MSAVPSPYPAWLAREERHVDREPVSVAARIGEHAAEVLDASGLGCRVRTEAPGGVGAFLTLSVGGRDYTGWVAWRRRDVLGLDFARAQDALGVAVLTGRLG